MSGWTHNYTLRKDTFQKPSWQTACTLWDPKCMGIQICLQCPERVWYQRKPWVLSQCWLQHHHWHSVQLIPAEFNIIELDWAVLVLCRKTASHIQQGQDASTIGNELVHSKWTSTILDAILTSYMLFQRLMLSERNLNIRKGCVCMCVCVHGRERLEM